MSTQGSTKYATAHATLDATLGALRQLEQQESEIRQRILWAFEDLSESRRHRQELLAQLEVILPVDAPDDTRQAVRR